MHVDSLDLADSVTDDIAPKPAPLVLLGASYLASWKLAEVGGRAVVNCGIAGNQTHEYLERFERDVVAVRPRAVVIWGIDNDVIRAPLDHVSEACRRVERNLESLVHLARVHGIEPILVTDLTLRPPARWYEWLAALSGWARGKEGYQQRINGHVVRVNASIRALAERTGTRLLDLHPLTVARNGMRARRYAKPDGSHLTEAGYRAVDAYVIPRLEAWLATPVPVPAPLAWAAGG
jgi:lysophospholipase L1-like esterase